MVVEQGKKGFLQGVGDGGKRREVAGVGGRRENFGCQRSSTGIPKGEAGVLEGGSLCL